MSNFQGRNHGKSVSFRNDYEEREFSDNSQRNSIKERQNFIDNKSIIDNYEERMVKLLPDANMTISIVNTFRESSQRIPQHRGSRGILKSNSFRDDTNLNSNTDRNNQYSNRGFETFGGRGGRGGRGRPRGFYHGVSSSSSSSFSKREYGDDYNQDNVIKPNHSHQQRPFSGTYDRYDNQYYRQSSDNYNNYQYHQSNEDNQDKRQFQRARQSSANYEDRGDEGSAQQYNNNGERNFRGRSKSANDRQRRNGRGGGGVTRGIRGTRGTIRHNGEETGDNKETGDNGLLSPDKDDTKESVWLKEEGDVQQKNEERKEDESNNMKKDEGEENNNTKVDNIEQDNNIKKEEDKEESECITLPTDSTNDGQVKVEQSPAE